MVSLWMFNLKWPLVSLQWLASGEYSFCKKTKDDPIDYHNYYYIKRLWVTSGLLLDISLKATPVLPTTANFWLVYIYKNDIWWPLSIQLYNYIIISSLIKDLRWPRNSLLMLNYMLNLTPSIYSDWLISIFENDPEDSCSFYMLPKIQIYWFGTVGPPMDILLRMTLRFPTVLNASEFQSLELCNGEIRSPYK